MRSLHRPGRPVVVAGLVVILAATGLAATGLAATGLAATRLVAGGLAASSRAPGSRVVLPRPRARWDYQIGGAVQYSPAPGAVSRDQADRPWPGVYSICYVNAFQSQPGDASLRADWLAVDGSPVEDPQWPGEYVLDTRGHRAQLLAAFTPMLTRCADKGFAAVELDNLDSYQRSDGALTRSDNVAYARGLVAVAHRLGLAAAQKNGAELVGRVPFDLAVTESCLYYDECATFTGTYPVVLDVEYDDLMTPATFQSACAAAVRTGSAPSFVLRDRAVTPRGPRVWCRAQHAS